jgi:hypothetical protein
MIIKGIKKAGSIPKGKAKLSFLVFLVLAVYREAVNLCVNTPSAPP